MQRGGKVCVRKMLAFCERTWWSLRTRDFLQGRAFTYSSAKNVKCANNLLAIYAGEK